MLGRSAHTAARTDQEEAEQIALAIALSAAESHPAQAGAPRRPQQQQVEPGVLSSYYPTLPGQQHHTQRPAPQPAAHQRPGSTAAQQPTPYQLYPPAAGYPPYPPSNLPYIPQQQPPQQPSAANPGGSSTGSRFSGLLGVLTGRPSQPSQPSSSHHQPPPQQQQGGQRRLFPDPAACAGCGRALQGGTPYLDAMSRKWHPRCFVCGFCDTAINQGGNTQFAIGASDGWPYHMDCFKHRFHPVCHICQEFIPERSDGRVEYREQGFWREVYCTRHTQDGTPQCCSCSRFQPKGVEFAQLSDGRHLCLTCIGSVIVDNTDIQPLYQEILQYYSSMGMPLPERAPLMAVDAFTLNDMSSKEGKSTSGGPVFHIRGLTLATVYRTISTVQRSGGGGLFGVSSVATHMPVGPVQCSVSAILVLYGLPRLLTGCIIAHELMHAWLRMRHIAGLDPKVEEGLCQLMAYMWLEQQHRHVSGDEARLASFFAYQIREDTSAVYGDGFREAFEAFQQRGLPAVINDVLRLGRIA